MGLFSWIIEYPATKADSTEKMIAKAEKSIKKAIETTKTEAVDPIAKSAANKAASVAIQAVTSVKNDSNTSQKQKRKEEKKQHEWKDINENIKFVCEGGKAMCLFCSSLVGDIKVTSTTVKLQDTPWATNADRLGASNLQFKGNCMHPSFSPNYPNCQGVIQLGEWKDVSKTIIDYYPALLRKSTIPCLISGQDIQIVHSGQKAILIQLKPKKEPEVKRIKIDFKELDEGSANDGKNGTQYGMIYGKKYHFEVGEFCENVEPQNDNTIKWEYSYINVSGEIVIGAFKKRGRKITLKIDDLDMLGTTITIRAYIDKRLKSQEKDIWIHYRFRWFDKIIFENGLNDRINNPVNIEQHRTSLCGTAAILYVTAKNSSYKSILKDAYMKFFRTGYNNINNFLLDPNPSLFEMRPIAANNKYPKYDKSSDLMKQTDWITLAGARSSDNKSYEGKQGEDWDAINWPSYMVKAAKEMYKASQVKDKTFFVTGFNFEDKLLKIQNEWQNEWQIILLIDADMLSDKVSYVGCLTNYHWIVYEGDLLIDSKKSEYTFSYYCWKHFYSKRKFRSNVFNTNFYGYIKFKI